MDAYQDRVVSMCQRTALTASLEAMSAVLGSDRPTSAAARPLATEGSQAFASAARDAVDRGRSEDFRVVCV